MSLVLERPKTGVTTRIFEKIAEIPRSVWDSVYPDVLEGYSFFKSLDESGFSQFSFRYILVYEDEEVVGAAPFFLMHYPLDTTVQGWLRSLMLAVKKIFPNAFNLKAVICGLPMDQARLGFREGKAAAVLSEIHSCLDRFAHENKVPIVAFKDLGLEYVELLDPYLKIGFSKVQNLPSTEIRLGFKSLDEYMKTLSRASRDGLKRKLKKLDAGPKFDLEVTNNLSPETLDEAYGLYMQAVERGETQFETVPKEFFTKVSENMPEETKFFLWRNQDGKMVAFAYCLASNDYFIDFYLGLDYATAFDHHLYFVRFRGVMEWCIRNDMRKFNYGSTGYEAKRRLGFKMTPLFIYAKCRNKWINPLFNVLCRVVKPENFHSVFKDMQEEAAACPTKG